MAETARLGSRIRALRRKSGMTQAQLATELGISASYLNLIEHNRRPLSAALLLRLATLFDIDLKSFSGTDEARLVVELMEMFADPVFLSPDLTSADVHDLAATHPELARAVLRLYHGYRGTRESMQALAARLEGDDRAPLGPARLPSEEVSDFFQKHLNHFPELEEGAERLARDARLDRVDLFQGLAAHLDKRHHVTLEVREVGMMRGAVRRYDAARRVLEISEVLRRGSRNFQVAHQVGLLTQSEVLDRLVRDEILTGDVSRSLGRVSLANYFAAAVLMPYVPFLDAARAERYDIDILGHRFRASYEQVCHRMTSLRRPGAEGVAFHLVRVDIAGNISKRFSASGMKFARFGAACPLWNVHAAFLTPGMARVQVSAMPDGARYLDVARTLRKDAGGYHSPHPVQAIDIGCPVAEARDLVYSDGIDLDRAETAVPVGVTCRICERMDCEQRSFPPLLSPMRIQENVRGSAFYAPVSD